MDGQKRRGFEGILDRCYYQPERLDKSEQRECGGKAQKDKSKGGGDGSYREENRNKIWEGERRDCLNPQRRVNAQSGGGAGQLNKNVETSEKRGTAPGQGIKGAASNMSQGKGVSVRGVAITRKEKKRSLVPKSPRE